MSEAPISEALRQFLLRHIDSIAQWEALLLLRSDPKKNWSAETLGRSLYITEKDAADLLMQLALRDMLTVEYTSPLTYRYEPKLPEVSQLIDQAAELYRQYLIPVTHIIHSKSRPRIQRFADAFKIKKD